MKIRSAIVCDDIRQEKNNKHILIGVYASSIRVAELPGALGLSYYAQVEAPEHNIGDELIFEVEGHVIDEDGKKKLFIKGKSTVTLVDDVIATIATPVFPIAIESECSLRLRIREVGERWMTALTTKVIYDPSLRPSS